MKQKAFQLSPRRNDIDKAVALHRAGRLDDAKRLYEQIIEAEPTHASAWHFLGVLQHQMGDSGAAVASITRALELDPRYADAHNNLGNIYRETDQYDAALRAYERAVAIAPQHADAWNNIGVMRSGRGAYAEAEQAYERALALVPSHLAAWQNKGSLAARINEFDASIAAYRRAIEVRPGDAVAYNALSRSLYRGCGTGLCADFLRRRAARLVGVDLSAGMLARARARNAYDELIESELASWLSDRAEEFDLIVSADTLCYFGALEQALAGAATALRPGGRVVFTVERAKDDVTNYCLDPTGRYSHAENYVRDALAAAGFHSIAVEHVVLRRERRQEVRGLLASARR